MKVIIAVVIGALLIFGMCVMCDSEPNETVNNNNSVGVINSNQTNNTNKADADNYLEFTLLSDGTYEVKLNEDKKFSITIVNIPSEYNGKKVTSINVGSLKYCRKLMSINVDENNVNYKSINGNLYSKDGKTLIRYAAGKANTSFAIPSGVMTIEDCAFYLATNLTSIKIPDEVISIGRETFSNSGLTSIALGNGIMGIPPSAFAGCDHLTSITLGNNVTSICEYAFKGCKNFKISIPDSIIHIDNTAFNNCSGIKCSGYNGGIYIGNSSNPYLVLVDTDSTFTTVAPTTKISCTDKVTVDINATSITIPSGVSNISSYAFYGCDNLTSITIPSAVTSIGDSAFSGCDRLANVFFENKKGWKAGTNSISETDLLYPNMGAKYLTDTYSEKTWTRT